MFIHLKVRFSHDKAQIASAVSFSIEAACEWKIGRPYKPRYEKTSFLHMRKQRRRSAAQ